MAWEEVRPGYKAGQGNRGGFEEIKRRPATDEERALDEERAAAERAAAAAPLLREPALPSRDVISREELANQRRAVARQRQEHAAIMEAVRVRLAAEACLQRARSRANADRYLGGDGDGRRLAEWERQRGLGDPLDGVY